jgi:protein TonB
MKSLSSSIPISRRIQPSVFAALVTTAVMCIFPLMEHFSENKQPIVHSQPVPVKITQFLPEASASVTQQTVQSKAMPQRRLSPIELPSAPEAPTEIQRIVLPPKVLPVSTTPPKEIPSPPPAPSVQNQPTVATQAIPTQEVNDTLPAATSITATNDASSSANVPQTYGSDMPDGKSLKHPPILLKQITPNYPEYARRRGIEGFVILQFTININGRVTNPSVQQANPPDHFETAALRAIKQWQFSPGRNDNGTPIPCRFQMRIDFKLENPTNHGYQIRLQ